MDWLNGILSYLDKLEGLPAAALIFLACIALGYMLRFIKPFPNSAIPVVVILFGALSMLFLADARPTTMPARIWTVRNLLVGLIIGFAAWIAHKLILSRIENLIGSKLPSTGDSTFFAKAPDGTVKQIDSSPVKTVAPDPKTP